MPFWGWLLVDLGILLAGSVWLLFLLWIIAQRGKRLARVTKPVLDALERIKPELEALESWNAGVSSDNPKK
jgi:hypothetical protein